MICQLESYFLFFLKKVYIQGYGIYIYKVTRKAKKSWKYIVLLINTLGFSLDTIWKIGCLLESECSNCHSKFKLVKRYSWATQTLEHNDLAPIWWGHSSPFNATKKEWKEVNYKHNEHAYITIALTWAYVRCAGPPHPPGYFSRRMPFGPTLELAQYALKGAIPVFNDSKES
jgi:hypothetical protein